MIGFLKYKRYCLVLSLVLLFGGTVFYMLRGGFTYNIDFTGGTEVRLEFDQSVDISKIRSVLDSGKWGEYSVQNLEGDKEFVVKIADTTPGAVEDSLVKEISSIFENKTTVKVRSVDMVGPEAGSEVRWNAIGAIIVTLLSLLLYISLRHQYAYSLGAIAALAHDLLVLLAFYLVFNEPISLNILGGILAVLGYSLNDTIVVFSRIRHNMKHVREKSMSELVDLSINQTLRRTILTSFTTFIAVLALYLFGGEILRGFAVTMMIAVVVGTYSSIYIASPVMMYFNSSRE